MSLMAIVSMTPLGKGESVSQYVAKVVAEIDKSGIPYIITPMGTIIESETWDELMDVLKRGFDSMARDCPRISIRAKKFIFTFRKVQYQRMVPPPVLPLPWHSFPHSAVSR